VKGLWEYLITAVESVMTGYSFMHNTEVAWYSCGRST